MTIEGQIRVVFMGSPAFAVPSLAGLHSAGYRIVGVYTQTDKPSGRGRSVDVPPVKQYAVANSLPVFQPPTLKNPQALSDMKLLEPDVLVVAAYGKILPDDIVNLAPFGCINVHPSLLPLYRGATPIPAAILNGDTKTGISIIMIKPGPVDSGPVLAQTEADIDSSDTTGTLTKKLSDIGADLLVATLQEWLHHQGDAQKITPRDQDHAKATLVKLIKKEDGKIDWQLPARDIWLRVRAYNPWPTAYTRWNEKLLKILDAELLNEDTLGKKPGTVVALKQKAIACGVVTGGGMLGLKTLQIEGRNVTTSINFINGARDFVGSVLSN
ncbi:MAG: methionyl-tRNA formyltransferase [Dehalococcoidia bacterium]|nr:methionyl-tRNA formyltransferase [Dehalococcoidia bacterium]